VMRLEGSRPHHACKLGLEGIVSKRLGSPYRSGRSPDGQALAANRVGSARSLVRQARAL
jgi:hypothetical protein